MGSSLSPCNIDDNTKVVESSMNTPLINKLSLEVYMEAHQINVNAVYTVSAATLTRQPPGEAPPTSNKKNMQRVDFM